MSESKKTFSDFLKIINDVDEYPNLSKLRYKYFFNQSDIEEMQKLKYQNKLYSVLPLKSDTDSSLLYLFTESIKRNLLGSVDLIVDSKIEELNQVDNKNIINGFISSEIENSLLIEGVHSSRKKIEKVSKKDYSELTNNKEVIIKNMLEGYNFILENKITIDNIYKLYNILSHNCLKLDEKLIEENMYRHAGVDIIGPSGIAVDSGVDYKQLPRLMEQLVEYINIKKTRYEHLVAPHIIHYYLIYLHPYFDYNGRMSRVLSFWYTLKNVPSISLLFTSEAINNPKNKKYYYKAIEYSREANNDITFFIEYLTKISFETTKSYINFYKIINSMLGNGMILTNAEMNAVKTVLSIERIGAGYFNWKKYKLYEFNDLKKQYILRLLNKLSEYKILLRTERKTAYLYIINYKKFDLL